MSGQSNASRGTTKHSSSMQFIEQLSKMLASPRKTSAARLKQQKRLLTLSPFLKSDTMPSPEKTARSARDCVESELARLKSLRRNRWVLESGFRRIADIGHARLRYSFGQVRRSLISALRRNVEGPSTRFDSQASHHSSFLSLTECPQCHHVGISLLTSSTKDQFSPKFLQKIRSLLPNTTENLSKTEPRAKDTKSKTEPKTKDLAFSMDQYEEAELQDIPDISDIHMEAFSVSSEVSSDAALEERGVGSLRAQDCRNTMKFDRSEEGQLGEVNLTDIPATKKWGNHVPKLNFTCVHSPVKAVSRAARARDKHRHKLSANTRVEQGVDQLHHLVLSRLQRAFYMTLLSRSKSKEFDSLQSPRNFPSRRSKPEKHM